MKWFLRLTAGLLLLVAVIAAGGYLYLRTSLPQMDGEIRLAGLQDEIRITRDASGVPHIVANTLTDALFGLGFVHAQDRLWQMETNRRIGAGRLSEIMGDATLDTDRFLRTLGVYEASRNVLPLLQPDTRDQLSSYAAGVNAFLGQTGPTLPPEFLILGVSPEPWKPEDSVVWTKMMAWDLGGNWAKELERMRLMAVMPPEKVLEFYPPYPGDPAHPLPDFREMYQQAGLDAGRLYAAAPEPLPEGAGSNNWVVSGAHTKTGKPLLANDPHLGLSAPALWYLAHIQTPDVDAIGATLPGVPAIILGRNQQIAWGFTNTGPDVQDLYIEKINPDNPDQYKTPTGWADFEKREETILVKDADPVTLTVRSTRHGPVLSDSHRKSADMMGESHALSLAWTALRLEDRTPDASARLMAAKNWDEFKSAIRNFNSPQQNMVYADTDGNIGYYAPGLVPVRKPENTARGKIPVPGWLADYDWDGYIPFEELPQAYNPPSGLFYTANHKIVPASYPHFITSDWSAPYRANRIRGLLDHDSNHSVESFQLMHGDVHSLMAEEFLEILLTTTPADDLSRDALIRLSTWDSHMTMNDPAPLIFSAWIRNLNKAVYADELGDMFPDFWRQRPAFLLNVLRNRGNQGQWCDDQSTPDQVETCQDILQTSLQTALQDLTARFGTSMPDWNWGDAHFAHGDHLPFSRIPVLKDLFDIRVPSMGGSYTVNVGRNRLKDEQQPFANTHAASLRAIYDFSDLDKSLFIHSTGQSGNILSRFYADMASDWAATRYRPMSTRPEDYQANAIGTLVLRPR
ncbi:penicillin amidase [Sneathiella chinensis]|uniref:Penicillin amidase n=2 Tax=Sneathiella chinensis TaxID=349750 RepID=A0ABQ5U2Q1_9PROT|nr:penicillin acylase family protein [Sneathiella chinensis]GLQ06452.1 penicillin amidase [Sneathiella chinensis]